VVVASRDALDLSGLVEPPPPIPGNGFRSASPPARGSADRVIELVRELERLDDVSEILWRLA
jgi:hypothetical protein